MKCEIESSQSGSIDSSMDSSDGAGSQTYRVLGSVACLNSSPGLTLRSNGAGGWLASTGRAAAAAPPPLLALLWMFLCRFISDLTRNGLWHTSHVYGFSPKQEYKVGYIIVELIRMQV